MKPLWMLRARRPVNARVSVVRRASALNSFARCSGVAFDSSQARNAVPICAALRAELQRRGDAAAIGNAARGDHRHFHGIDHLRNQRQRAGQAIFRLAAGTKRDVRPPRNPTATIMSTPASASSLASAGGGGGAQRGDAGAAATLEHVRRRHAEHETEHRRPQLQHRLDLLLVVRPEARGPRRHRHAQLVEVRPQQLAGGAATARR